MFKYCKRCGFETERNKQGACKVCAAVSSRRHREKARATGVQKEVFCSKCNAVTKRRLDGFCMECDRKKAKARRDAGLKDERRNRYSKMTPEQKAKADVRRKRWDERHPEKAQKMKDAAKEAKLIRSRQWAKDNPEKQKARTARYHKENPQKASERSRLRRGAMKNRMVAWADQEAIRKIYQDAVAYREAGIDCEVDHIYPLQGDWVSGLHCEANLQIISAHSNRSKQNRRIDIG